MAKKYEWLSLNNFFVAHSNKSILIYKNFRESAGVLTVLHVFLFSFNDFNDLIAPAPKGLRPHTFCITCIFVLYFCINLYSTLFIAEPNGWDMNDIAWSEIPNIYISFTTIHYMLQLTIVIVLVKKGTGLLKARHSLSL